MAARLGGRELDNALRQLLLRADPTEELTAALLSAPPRDGRTVLRGVCGRSQISATTGKLASCET